MGKEKSTNSNVATNLEINLYLQWLDTEESGEKRQIGV